MSTPGGIGTVADVRERVEVEAAPVLVADEPAAWLAEAESVLAEAARAVDAAILMLALPAPVVAAETLLEASDRPLGMLWDPPEGATFSALDAVDRLRAEGPERFETLRRDADRVLAEVRPLALGGADVPAPRLWGGLAFDVGAASAAPWSDFGDAELILPRFVYRREGDAGSLALTLRADEASDAQVRGGLLAELDDLRGALGRSGHQTESDAGPASHAPVRASNGSRADWIRRVEEIRAAIRRDDVEKIVAARRFEVEVDADLDVPALLRSLARGLRRSTRFAFCRASSAFLGATPERLIACHGARFETEALAGSIESGGEHAAELLDSGKDLHEQQLVTDSIVRRLAPLCDELEVASRPTVRELRDVLHLHTPIRGTLKEHRHVLELVEALHPTPAVGGVPTPDAMAWIAEHETHPRGWYAAPVGWLDAQGDGEFFVALRSCIVEGGTAYLYGGAGIVGDSDPVAELRETELKIHGLLEALAAVRAANADGDGSS